jgi:hypothetical protein
MKKYRRIEITAFRRRVTIISPCEAAAAGEDDGGAKFLEDVRLTDADTRETIEIGSAEGQRLLLEALRLLEEKLSGSAPEGRSANKINAREQQQEKEKEKEDDFPK